MQDDQSQEQASVSWFVFNGSMARMERIIKVICIVFLIGLLVVSSALIINDNNWRKYCAEMEQRYANQAPENPGLYEQPDQGPDP